MKTMKRLFALALVLVMVMGLAVSASAADTTKLTVTGNTAGRTFEAHMLMSVSVAGDNYSHTVNAKYATVLKNTLGLASTATNEEVVEAVAALTVAEDMRHFADDLYFAIKAAGLSKDYPTSGTWNGTQVTVDQGYWLVADVTDLSEAEGKTNSLVMVDTAGDDELTVAMKDDTTITVKKVDDENDSLVDPVPNDEDDVNWQEVSDYDIGDSVPYVINGQLPNNITEYTYYSFKIVDKASAGLTFNKDFTITVNAQPKTIAEVGSSGAGTADFLFEIDATNTLYIYPNHGYTTNAGAAKAADSINGGDFLKLFPAGTDHSAINNSTFNLKYTCTLNENAVHGSAGNTNSYQLFVSNNPYGDTFGETPEDTTITFTYKFVVNKTDAHGNALKGADFELYKFVAVKENYDSADPATIPAGVFKHSAANCWGSYVVVAHKETNAVVGEATQFSFNGLDDGYYKLSETTRPEGYNPIADIEFQIVANHVTDVTSVAPGDVITEFYAIPLVAGTLDITADEGAGTLTTVVENHSGNELPSTGGIGTTIFYVLGGVLAVAAVVLLITKKRMAVEE